MALARQDLKSTRQPEHDKSLGHWITRVVELRQLGPRPRQRRPRQRPRQRPTRPRKRRVAKLVGRRRACRRVGPRAGWAARTRGRRRASHVGPKCSALHLQMITTTMKLNTVRTQMDSHSRHNTEESTIFIYFPILRIPMVFPYLVSFVGVCICVDGFLLM